MNFEEMAARAKAQLPTLEAALATAKKSRDEFLARHGYASTPTEEAFKDAQLAVWTAREKLGIAEEQLRIAAANVEARARREALSEESK